jgi:hypothetical protein
MLLGANSLTVGSPADSNGMDPAQCSKIARQDLINAFALASEAFMIWSRRLWASRRFDVCHEKRMRLAGLRLRERLRWHHQVASLDGLIDLKNGPRLSPSEVSVEPRFEGETHTLQIRV